MRLTLVFHRQDAPPRVEEHEIDGLRPQMSLLDVPDLLDARLLESSLV